MNTDDWWIKDNKKWTKHKSVLQWTGKARCEQIASNLRWMQAVSCGYCLIFNIFSLNYHKLLHYTYSLSIHRPLLPVRGAGFQNLFKILKDWGVSLPYFFNLLVISLSMYIVTPSKYLSTSKLLILNTFIFNFQ